MKEALKHLIFEGLKVDREDVARLENLEIKPRDDVKSHLIVAYGLAELYPFVRGNPEFEEQGFLNARQWVAERGRPVAIKRVLGWLGLKDAKFIERGTLRHWPNIQIGLTEPVSAQKIEAIKGVCSLSVPARTRLERIFLVSKDRKALQLSNGGQVLSGSQSLSKDGGEVGSDGITMGEGL